MFTMLKLIPNLLGAKVEIKFLYFDPDESKIETTSYDQAIIEKLSPNIEIKRLYLTLSHCLIGIKRVPGIHRYAHVVMVEHLRVIKEGHSDIKWESKHTMTPREKILERLCTLAKSQYQNPTDDNDDDWDVTSTTPTQRRLSAQLKKDPTPDPSPSPPPEQCYSQRLANLSSAWPKVIASTPATKSRFRKTPSVHKFTKAFGSEQLNILPLSYRWHDQFTVKEGKLIKYKGHKSFAIEQLSVRAKHTQSRRHISPVACGMINNEDGGIILMGVQDNGLIDGLMLSKAQQEHLVANISDTFDRYWPKVPRHFYDINFIRVKLTNSKAKEEKAYLADETNIPHLLRTTKLCWCDHRAMTSINLGLLHKCLIIKLKIHPRDRFDPRTIRYMRSATFADENQIFLTETGKCYYRLKDVTNRIA